MTKPDPHLVAFARECIRDLVSEVGRKRVEHREALVYRLASALQQAAEQEYAALVEELTA